MSARTRNGKTFAQDALGFVFCLVGWSFAVWMVLYLSGQEPKPGPVSALTSPAVELVTLLGGPAALFFAVGLSALGTLLFLRSTPLTALRPLLALSCGSVAVALVLGVFGGKGELGAWLPGLVPGPVGRVLALVLGVALAWLGWTLVATERLARSSSAELVQRIGPAPRTDASSGVSPAEAALLVSEPRVPLARPAPHREAAVPVRDETIRPYTPPDAPGSAPRAPRVAAPTKPARAAGELVAGATKTSAPAESVAAHGSSAIEPQLSVLTPPAPSWEGVPEEVQEEEEEAAQRLSEALSEEFETEEASALSTEEELGGREEEEEEEDAEGEGEEEALPRASWEQIGLFDEEEELEEETPPVKPAKVELTSTFDFEAAEPPKPRHEPEPSEEESSALAATTHAPAAPETQGFLLQPTPAPRPEPSVALEVEGEGWNKLVYDAGCVILEQERVAVSMLERRFGIDFDQACRVLDELQQAGLIGPYMGGRTRDILLTREQWLPHAPHAS